MRVPLGKRMKKEPNRTRLALDIGTEYVKALVVSVGKEPTLLGVGRARQTVGDMEDGAVARIAGVVQCCHKAVEQAYSVADHSPIEAVIGVAGEHVHGGVTTFQIRRRRATVPITENEFNRMLNKVRQKAQSDVVRTLEEQTGLKALDVELLNTTLLEVKIDGYRVKSPVHFRGTYVDLKVFHTFAPLVHIGDRKSVV